MGRKHVVRLLVLICLVGSHVAAEVQAEAPSTLVFPTFQHTWGIRKATAKHLFMFVGLKTRFDDPQGLAAVRLLAWEDPATEDDDDELVVYGVNSGRHNIIWNTSMYSVGIYGQEGSGKGQFRHPRGIAADPRGDVWVADTGNHRIAHLFNTGQELVWKGTIGEVGSGPGQFRNPSGVAVDSRGWLYVADTGNSRIQIFDHSGQQAGEIKADLSAPEGIAVIDAMEPWSYYRDTFLCVTDRGGRRLVKFSTAGEMLALAEESQTGMERACFGYLAIDYYGNVWATDPENHCLHKFDRNLDYIVSFGKEGSGDGEFRSPKGVAIWRRFGQVFVAEQTGAQYYWVGTDLLDAQVVPVSSGQGFDIHYTLTERAFVTVQVFDDRGQEVGTLVEHRMEPTGQVRHRWDGRRPDGTPPPAGPYTIRITAEPTYSSYHYFRKIIEKKIR